LSASRLNIALRDGAVMLPESGRIAVFRPRADMDLSALPQDRVQVIQGFRPDHDALAARGFDTGVAATGDFAAALVCATRSREETRALVAQAAALGGPVLVDGAKTDGIESLLRDIRKRAEVGEVVSKAHGKIFAFTGGDFADWAGDPAGRELPGGFVTRAGVFSADGIDAGSQALARALPGSLSGHVADLGAGWGYLSRAILERKGVKELHLVEAEHAALDCARLNVTDARARFHWADATRWRPPAMLDAVVMNPPFHAARAADPGLGRAFIAAAAGMLKPSSKLWLVANRHLPYEAEVQARFGAVDELAGTGGFKLICAAKPRRARR